MNLHTHTQSQQQKVHPLTRRFSQAATQQQNEKAPELFTKILIANRGEIACRIIKTAKLLGIKTVAVFSEADENSMHVKMADEAYCIGPAPSKESYLVGSKIIEVAKKSGAQGIHPGYGFLSEKEDFAKLCEENGITFIGPPASAIKAMGSKSASKDIMGAANVPLTPGYHGDNQDPQFLKQEAAKIGYPVLIKAVLGGGGKGMKIVEKPEEFESQLESAKREAINSFSDDRVLIEKYLVSPRHVEFQVFGDNYGNYVYLFERDCSVQRRHQKVIEEAPAPNMSPELRAKMGEAAVNAARAVGYVGAGTVEFIVDSETMDFYFMEMNTRLQVEHPITEKITGQDLVEWQLYVASGFQLPFEQSDLAINGWAFEARIYAENPENNFLPDVGKLVHLEVPEVSEHVRVDTGVRVNDEVKIFYDPMIAKLVVWDSDRESALERLSQALNDYQIVGLSNNVKFLKRLADHPEFRAGRVTTAFIPQHFDSLLPPPTPVPDESVALAALGLLLQEEAFAQNMASWSSDPNSPFKQTSGKRLNSYFTRKLNFVDNNKDVQVEVTYLGSNKFVVKTPSGATFTVSGELEFGNQLRVNFDGRLFRPTVVVDETNKSITVFSDNTSHKIDIKVPQFTASAAAGSLLAPMPGKIIKVLVNKGDKVVQGDPLVIMEAMKMEHVIRATGEGVVKNVNFKVNDTVAAKATLVEMEESEEQKQ